MSKYEIIIYWGQEDKAFTRKSRSFPVVPPTARRMRKH